MAVAITDHRPGRRAVSRRLRRTAGLALDAVGRPGGDVEIHLVDDREIRRLNRQFRGIRRRTDVLAFPVEVPGAAAGLLGQIMISEDAARRQARRIGVPLVDELRLLVTHGVLHLVGWDDRDPVEADLMHRRERDVLSADRRRLPDKLWTGLLPHARGFASSRIRARLDAPHLDTAHPRQSRARGPRYKLDAPHLDTAHPRQSRARGPRYK
jgi:probable rRNA maturation factor